MERTRSTAGTEKQILALEFFSSDSFLSVNKRLLGFFGPSITIFLCNLIDKYKYFKEKGSLNEDGSFFLCHEDQTHQTGMNEYELRKCKKVLKAHGILSTYMKGIPPKEFYCIHLDVLVEEFLRNIPLKFKGINIENLKERPFKIQRNIKETVYKDNVYKDNVYNKDTKVSYGQTKFVHVKEIEEIISFWNNLPNTQKHLNPETKVYTTACSMLDNLLSGYPINPKKDGSAKIKLQRFANDFNIPEELLNKSWSQQEIQDIIQSIHDAHFDPHHKQSLPETIWQEFARKNKGYSLFLIEAIKKNIPNKYLKLADIFSKIVPNNTINPSKRYNWAHEFQILIETEKEPFDEVKALLEWYVNNHEKKYVPKAADPLEFCDKYNKMKRAMNNGYDKEKNNSSKQQEQKITETPKQKIYQALQDKDSQYSEMLYNTFLEAKKKLFPSASAFELDTLANNIIAMYKEIRQEKKKYINMYGTHIQEHMMQTVKIIREFILWINEQNWIHNITPGLFDIEGKMFNKFLNDYLIEENFHFHPIKGDITTSKSA